MTTVTRTDVIFSTANSTSYRAWVQAIRDACIAVGLVKTGDTGQIDLTTVVAPTGGNTSGGYDIFRFNDALQGARPVFIKLEYGLGTVSGASMSMAITVGTSTDGAGTINSSLIAPRRILGSGSATNAAAAQFLAAGDGSFLSLMWPTAAINGFLSIERTRGPNGVANGDGLLIAQRSNNAPTYNLCVMSFLNFSVSDGAADNAAVPGAGFNTAAFGGDVSFFPRLVMLPKLEFDLAIMFAYTADVVANTTYTITNGGAPHVYQSFTPATNPIAGVTGFVPLVRFE